MNTQSFDITENSADNEKFLSGFCKLLAKETRRFTGCDSTSVSVERACALSESVLYTIGINTDAGMSPEEILNSNPEQLLRSGRQILKDKKAAAFDAWKSLLQAPPRVRNVFFTDTVKGLGAFFKYYDILYSAHCIPCSIDYWPMIPMPDSFKGVSYIEEYLRRLCIEARFLRRFSPETVRKLYSAQIPDYHTAFFNLCDPVLTAEVIRIIAGESETTTDITAVRYSTDHDKHEDHRFRSGSSAAERRMCSFSDNSEDIASRLRERLFGKDKIDTLRLVESAVEVCCIYLGLSESDTDYLLAVSPEIAALVKSVNGDGSF